MTRLVLEQFGSNEASTVLQNQLLSDSKTFDVTIERFNISSDIPIFPANTHVFDIINTDGKTTGDQLYAAGTPFVSCKIGQYTTGWISRIRYRTFWTVRSTKGISRCTFKVL